MEHSCALLNQHIYTICVNPVSSRKSFFLSKWCYILSTEGLFAAQFLILNVSWLKIVSKNFSRKLIICLKLQMTCLINIVWENCFSTTLYKVLSEILRLFPNTYWRWIGSSNAMWYKCYNRGTYDSNRIWTRVIPRLWLAKELILQLVIMFGDNVMEKLGSAALAIKTCRIRTTSALSVKITNHHGNERESTSNLCVSF